MIRTALWFSVAVSMLLASPFSAYGEERFVTPVSYGPIRASFSAPAIATDGQTFLTAWVESAYGRGSRIVVQRLDQASPTSVPKPVYADPGLAHSYVDLAWTGSSYLMVYTVRHELRSIRLDPAGNPLPGTARVLAVGILEPALASHGSTSLVVARTTSGRNETIALALNENDDVVRQEVVWDHVFTIIDVEATESGFAVIISSNTGLAFFRMDRSGNWLDPEARLIMASSGTTLTAYRPLQVRLSGAGPRTLVVWTANAYNSPTDLFSVIIGPSGELAPVLALPHGASAIWSIDVVREANGYHVLLTSGVADHHGSIVDADLETLRLDDDGRAVSEPRPFGPTIPLDNAARLARNTNGYGVVWKTDVNPSWGETRLAGHTGPSLDLDAAPLLLSRTVTDQVRADVAGDGLGYLVTWLDEVLDRQKVIAARVDANARVVGQPLVLFDVPFSYLSPPRVVYGHGMYLVAWNVAGALWGVRIDEGGRLLDTEPVRLSGSSRADQDFDVTASPDGFFAVWSSGRIMGAELTLAGPVAPHALTIPLPLPPDYTSYESAPRVAFNGESYLLAYTFTEYPPCLFPACPSSPRILISRLDRDSLPSGQPVRVEGEVREIVSGGGTFALLRFGTVNLVEPQTLKILGSVPYYDNSPHHAALTWDGSSYRLLWFAGSTNGSGYIFQRRIGRDGTPEDARPIGLMPGAVFDFRAAATLAGDLLAVYSRRPQETPFNGAARVVVQRLDGTTEQPAPVRRRPVLR